MAKKITQTEIEDIIKLFLNGESSRTIAQKVLGTTTRKSTINDLINRMGLRSSTNESVRSVAENLTVVKGKTPIIKIVDVETSPELSLTFGRFKVFISPDQVLERSHMLSYSAVDLWESDEVESRNLTHYPAFEEDIHDDYDLVCDIWELLDKTDVIIAHNGIRFDKAYIQTRFAFYGMPLPSPYVVIDTLRTLKSQFKLGANSLKEATTFFDTPAKKQSNEGFNLWKRCFFGDEKAFEEMQEYNDYDVLSLRDLYRKILPYVSQHPNVSSYYDDEKVRCPRCGSVDVKMEEGKMHHTHTSSFQVIRCNSCGGLSRDRVNLKGKDKRFNTLMPL